MSLKSEKQTNDNVNSTMRLVLVLEKMDRTNSTKTVAQAICDTLEINTGEPSRSRLLALSFFSRIIEAAERESQKHFADDWETVGPHFTGVRRCLDPEATGVQWSQRKSSLTAADITGLRHTALHLKRYVHERPLGDEQISDVRHAVAEMAQALEDESLSKRSREVLEDRLEAIRRALDEYRFLGISEIRGAYDSFVGTVIADPDVRETLRDNTPATKSLGLKVLSVIGVLTVVLTFANTALKAEENFLPIIQKLVLHAPAGPADTDDGAPLNHADRNGNRAVDCV